MASKLEERMLTLLTELAPEIAVVREYTAIEGRRFRFDFWLPDYAILIEVQGGTYNGGRHTRGVGMDADCEKSRLAQMLGYDVLCYTGKQITKENVQELVDYARAKVGKGRKPKQQYNNSKKRTNVRKQK